METFRVTDVAVLLRHASMSASYKPALLKALVRVSRKSTSLAVALGAIGQEFARMYWNQTVVYHLRQASSLTKESEVIKLIRSAAEQYRVRFYAELPEEGKMRSRRTSLECKASHSKSWRITIGQNFLNHAIV